MHFYRLIVPMVVAIYFLSGGHAAVQRYRRSGADLTFAESVYIKLSGACEWLSFIYRMSMTFAFVSLSF